MLRGGNFLEREKTSGLQEKTHVYRYSEEIKKSHPSTIPE